MINLFILAASLKVYLNRSINYISMLNFAMIIANFKINYELDISLFLLIPVGLFLSLFLGYIDYKLIMKHELAHINENNNIKSQVASIELKIDDLLEKKGIKSFNTK